MHNIQKKQRGFIVGSSLVVIALIVSFIYITFAQEITDNAKLRRVEQQEEWLNEAKNAIHNWYERNTITIDSNIDVLARDDVFTGAGLTSVSGIQFQSTARLTDGAVFFHRIAIWYPVAGVTGTGFDAEGVFQTGVDSGGSPASIKYALIDGRMIEITNYRKTISRMRTLAKRFEFWFQTQVLINPSRLVGDNHFRDDDCAATPPEDRLPCIDTYTALDDPTAAPIQTKVGFGLDDIRDDWGQTYMFTNLHGIPTPPPYTIAIQSNPPWGIPITVYGFASE